MVVLSELSKEGRLPRKDLTGQRFERLVVKEWLGRNKSSVCIWKCICDCGNFKNCRTSDLTSMKTKSCGCFLIEMLTKHGLSSSRVYRAWADIKSRCLNPKNARFASYGGRGIGIFNGWQDDFQAFYDHVGEPPSLKHSIDRIDNELGYYPGNVRWATMDEQQCNRRVTIWVNFRGERQALCHLAKQYNLSADIALNRLKLGWDIEKVLCTPVRKKRFYKNASRRSARTTPSLLSV